MDINDQNQFEHQTTNITSLLKLRSVIMQENPFFIDLPVETIKWSHSLFPEQLIEVYFTMISKGLFNRPLELTILLKT